MSSHPDGVDYETALLDPAAYYPDPEAIMADTDLTDGQKHRFLSAWRQDLLDRQEAETEGMGPERGSTSAKEADWVKRIHNCLDQLPHGADNNTEQKKSFWRRLLPS